MLTLAARIEAHTFEVIVHPDNPTTSVSRDELSKLYLKRVTTWRHGEIARPVDQARDNQGGRGALELALRYSRLDLTDGTVEGGELDVRSLGINWWLTRRAQFSVDSRDISLDRIGIQGDSSGLNARMLLLLD